MEQGTSFLLLLLVSACFRLIYSRRFIGAEPKEKFGNATLFVIGIDEERITQTLVENLGLWEAMEWDWLYHYNENKYTRTKLNEKNLEETLYHLGTFGVVGEITENQCVHTPLAQAADHGHWIVGIFFKIPSCDSESFNWEDNIRRKYEMLCVPRTREIQDFWERKAEWTPVGMDISGHPFYFDFEQISRVPPWDRSDIADDLFWVEREEVNYELYRQEELNKKGWPVLKPDCYAEAPKWSDCLEGKETICTQKFHETKFNPVTNETCKDVPPDCRTCPKPTIADSERPIARLKAHVDTGKDDKTNQKTSSTSSLKNSTVPEEETWKPPKTSETSVHTTEPSPDGDPRKEEETEGINLTAVIGGSVGMLILAALIVAVIVAVVKRKRLINTETVSMSLTAGKESVALTEAVYSAAETTNADAEKPKPKYTGPSPTTGASTAPTEGITTIDSYETFSVTTSQTSTIDPISTDSRKMSRTATTGSQDTTPRGKTGLTTKKSSTTPTAGSDGVSNPT